MQNLTSKTWFQFLVALRKGRVVHEIFMLSINWKVQFYSQLYSAARGRQDCSSLYTKSIYFFPIAFKCAKKALQYVNQVFDLVCQTLKEKKSVTFWKHIMFHINPVFKKHDFSEGGLFTYH